MGDLLVLAAACWYAPMMVWANNVAEVGVPYGLLGWIALLWICSILVRWLGVRAGLESRGVTVALFWLLLGIGSTRWMIPALPGGAWTLGGVLVVTSSIVYRLRAMSPIRWATSWAVTFVAIAPVALGVASYLGRGPSLVASVHDLPPVRIRGDEDVILLVFDAHGSPDVLEDDYGMGRDWIGRLQDRGLWISSSINANYSMTHVSLASFFLMDYPLRGGADVGEAEWADLLRVIDGDNPLVEAFRAAGYDVVFVESGWSSIRCTSLVDTCIHGVWPDNATALAIEKGLVGTVDALSLANSYARGNLHSIAWLENGLAATVHNGRSELVIAHLLLPHPPFRLNEMCSLRPDPGPGNTIISWTSLSREEIEVRKRLYVDQVRCATEVLSDVVETLGDEAALVAFGDHGPDSRFQLTSRPSDWSDQAVRERFGTFLATNLNSCGFDRVRSLVNVGRVLLSCLGNQPLPLVDDRYFIVVEGSPLLELPAARVETPTSIETG